MRSICLALCLIVLPSIPALAVDECCTIVSVDRAAKVVIVQEIATGKTKTLTISNTQLLELVRPGMKFGPTAIAGIQKSPRIFEPDWIDDCCNFRAVPQVQPNAGAAKHLAVAKGLPQYTGTIGSVEIGPGVSVDNISITRLGSRTVRLKFDVSNTSGEDVHFVQFGMASRNRITNLDSLTAISLLDFDGGKRYTVLKDEEGDCVCSTSAELKLGSKERRTYWANFAAPPPSVASMTLDIPGGVPIDNIPVK